MFSSEFNILFSYFSTFVNTSLHFSALFLNSLDWKFLAVQCFCGFPPPHMLWEGGMRIDCKLFVLDY